MRDGQKNDTFLALPTSWYVWNHCSISTTVEKTQIKLEWGKDFLFLVLLLSLHIFESEKNKTATVPILCRSYFPLWGAFLATMRTKSWNMLAASGTCCVYVCDIIFQYLWSFRVKGIVLESCPTTSYSRFCSYLLDKECEWLTKHPSSMLDLYHRDCQPTGQKLISKDMKHYGHVHWISRLKKWFLKHLYVKRKSSTSILKLWLGNFPNI